MIRIYSADAAGRLFTDQKQRAYIDADTLREHATAARIRAKREELARAMGFSSWEELDTFTRCSGLTEAARDRMISAGTLPKYYGRKD